MNYDVAIVGGGAAGLACAARITQLTDKLNIVIIEAADRLGKKLSATGNGQGNVTNRNMSAEFYFSGNISLVKSVALSPEHISLEDKLFHFLLSDDTGGRVYPNGKQASALTDSLIFDIKKAGVSIITGTKVTDIQSGYKLTLSDGHTLGAKFVVLCVGGKAQKQFKTDGSAYSLAQKFGHRLTALYPSLVQLKTNTEHIKTLKGIRVDCRVTAFCSGKPLYSTRGDVIFTDYGVSGNAIFAISAYIADKEDVVLSLDLVPDDNGKLVDCIRERRERGYDDSELLGGTLHNQLGRAVIRRCGGKNDQDIVKTAKNFTLNVIGSLGFDYAQVTRGGVCLDGVTDELESKYSPELFLAGEMLDVDGCCGGYNLHWAFSSGYTVAEAIVKRV